MSRDLALGGLLALILLAATLVMMLTFSTADTAYRVYLPEGYINQVKTMIEAGRLAYDCENEQIRPATDLSPAERNFYLNSYLTDDIEAWNAGDRRPFLVSREELRGGGCKGRLTGVDPNYHKQRLPTYEAKTWRGNLYLRPTPGSTVLTSADRSLEVLPVAWDLLPLPAQAFEDTWFRPGSEGIRSQRLALKMLERGRAFGTLKNVGDNAVLEILGNHPTIYLNGCSVPLGWRVRLDDGDTLHVREPGRVDERYLVATSKEGGLVSFLTEVNGEPERRSFEDRLAIVREVAWAVDSVVNEARVTKPGAVRDDFDVYLTLDPFLHQRMERGLRDFARDRKRYDRRPLRAAITVMDAASGRLLALASYPTVDDLRDLGFAAPSTRRRLLLQNHNFLLHPVGSAAKPFLAAAALAVHPELASLEIPCFSAGTPPKQLLGYDMGTYNLPEDCDGKNASGRVDFPGFLAVSSNRYMLYLGLLAMADWDVQGPVPVRGAPRLPRDEAYVLGGRTFSAKPRLPIVRADEDTPGDGFTELQEVMDQTPFPRRFRDLFGYEVSYRQESLVEGLDLSIWQPTIDAAFGRLPQTGSVSISPTPESAISFSPITPESVNLRMNLIQQLRQDLYTLLLGNGNNRWSNIQMAEALSRLLTGRQVEASLVEKVEVPEERSPTGQLEVLWDLATHPEPPGLPEELQDSQRQLILEGMGQVVAQPRGTAYKLGQVIESINRRAPEGVTYSALGKTGTPTLALSTVRRSPTDHAPSAVRRYSPDKEPEVSSAILVLAVSREQDGEREDLALTFFIEAQGGSGHAVALAASILEPLVEARWPQDWLKKKDR